MHFIQCVQGTPEWLAARAGVSTASNFKVAISKINMPTEQQQTYIDAIQRGADEKEAMLAAGYKAKPKADVIERALSGLPVGEPSDPARAYAARVAIERISEEPSDEGFNSWQMKRGQELEPDARRLYEIATGNMAMESGVVLTDDRLFGYSTDGFVEADGLIEIKSLVSPIAVLDMWRTGDMSEYMHQMQGGMWITGRLWCDFVMYCPQLASVGKELFLRRVLRDDDFIEKMEGELMAFSRLVDENERLLRGAAETLPLAA